VVDTTEGLWFNIDMTSTEKFNEATSQRDAARIAFQAATTNRARRDAAEELEFWTSKVAMLGVMVERGI
jgi:hypothetical protein